MAASEQEDARLHITKHSRKGARGKSSDLIPLTAGARAGTTPIHCVASTARGEGLCGSSSSASRLHDVI